MKKLLSTILIVLIATFVLGTASNATTKNELKAYLLHDQGIAGSDLIIRNADKVKVERFFNRMDMTDAQATEIKTYVDAAITLMTSDGATEPNELSTRAKKEKLLSLAQQAAAVLGLTVSYDSTETRLDIYKDGELYDSLNWGVPPTTKNTTTTATTQTNKKTKIGTSEPSLVKTGSTNYEYVIAAGVVLIAGITLVVARKKSLNAVA